MSKILVTGAAGFIGFHLVKSLLDAGNFVVGLDNINDYYDVDLKYARLRETGILRSEIEWGLEVISERTENYIFSRMHLEDKANLKSLFEKHSFDVVVNLAAQAGVRYSLENPEAYVQSNVVGFLNILECCRHFKIKHLIYASSSSVYGQNEKVPFAVTDPVDNPISLYAATKKSNELMAYTYSHLYGIPTTGLRFFTVYGPWGRPDMAIYLFTQAILNGESIKVFNNGKMRRDFTYIDDIIAGIDIVLKNTPEKNESTPAYSLYNIGNGKPEALMDFVDAIETSLGIEAVKEFLPMQAGDVPQTWADTSALKVLGYTGNVSIREGVDKFIKWYRLYHNV
ncbi:NAD-dependent epimerase/dehydratase family protein [Leeuwenhoekiella polynyae]|uniref:UDP-glucuronate 4-epimerase n=1 Tax=Leeuwenhoekiella polynyae TaxID=1550906 RepID=A0A4Q0NV37_9FLAO|nr:NAD-dependent epimerase/dehydratase family protein [Leeuwenhoekiella polynyae]RXG14691.1 UDP-glucuronate 4-epimerase [Leeuwenhoekiella polynyae]